jgi:CheY-like chemotaxis protein
MDMTIKDDLLKGKKILIVEDDLPSRFYLNKILERTGARLLNAGDGKEAFDIASMNIDLDFILMDIQLPLMDGYTSTLKIRELGRKVIIIAQTAYGFTGDIEKIFSSGFDDYIVKPVFASQLIEKLAGFLK